MCLPVLTCMVLFKPTLLCLAALTMQTFGRNAVLIVVLRWLLCLINRTILCSFLLAHFFSCAFLILVQECCYHAAEPAYGALLTNYPDGGNAVRYSHLVYDPVIYSAEETLPYSYCCEQEKLCGYFYEKRPSGVSVGYDATQLGMYCGWVWSCC